MQSLYDKTAYNEIMDRLTKLSPQAVPAWGKMNVSQMMAHCSEALRVPLSDQKMPRMFMGRLLGWVFKKQLSLDKPYKKSLPTAPAFIIKDDRNFEKERNQLSELITSFFNRGPEKTGKYPHPFFGTLTKEQWGKAMYKHTDHHLQQFGA
jgi:hypothetical protein